MTETSKLKKYTMWYKVKEFLSKNYKTTQISSMLGIHRQTVAKYRDMTEEEFVNSQSYDRKYGHKLDEYEAFVVEELRLCPSLSSPQIHDHLKEKFSGLPIVSDRTVYNFVTRIRSEYGLPKENEPSFRPYEMQPQTPYGEYAQVDFGERWMKDRDGRSVKVYFFVMSLSRSRYKFVYFSLRPFTTALAVYAHELGFQYYGGVPEKIVYDQDKVLLNDENLGDFVLTRGFKTLVRECGFTPVFCRKSDPESKGKIENAVKYVKYNFLRGRVFVDIDTLNEQGLAWLERTANGTEHHGIRRIPAEEFKQEKASLKPYNGVPTEPKEDIRQYHVRKDNVVNYHGNYYTVPTGTYMGRDTMVYITEKDGTVTILSVETGKTIATHGLCTDKGQLVRDRSHQRDRRESIDEYEAQTKAMLPENEIIAAYLCEMRADKTRHYRDNLKFVQRAAKTYSCATLVEAFEKCRECRVYNAQSLMAVAETLRISKGEAKNEPDIDLAAQTSLPDIDMTPDKTDINSFEKLFA